MKISLVKAVDVCILDSGYHSKLSDAYLSDTSICKPTN